MDISRRDYLKAVGAGAIVGTTGCVSRLNEATKFTADPALLDDEYMETHTFERNMFESRKFEESIEVFGEEVSVSIQGWLAQYGRIEDVSSSMPSDMSDGSMTPSVGGSAVSLLTSPAAEINGRSVNPLASGSFEEVVGTAISSIDNIELESDEPSEEYTTQFVGSDSSEVSVEVSVYDAVVKSDGRSLETAAHIGRVTNDEDVIISVAAHKRGDQDEFDIIQQVFENVEHPAELPDGYSKSDSSAQE